LIGVWITDHRLGSRFEVLQRMIALQRTAVGRNCPGLP
jgi:hypothetical protein